METKDHYIDLLCAKIDMSIIRDNLNGTINFQIFYKFVLYTCYRYFRVQSFCDCLLSVVHQPLSTMCLLTQ